MIRRSTILLFILSACSPISFTKASSESLETIKDIQLAAQLGSGQPVTIDVNATEGLEGKIAEAVKNATQETPAPTFWQRIKSFFSDLF